MLQNDGLFKAIVLESYSCDDHNTFSFDHGFHLLATVSSGSKKQFIFNYFFKIDILEVSQMHT